MNFGTKVQLKEGQVHCDRCAGYRIFFVRVHNDQGVPAQPDKGICYRCGGSGVDPHIKARPEPEKVMDVRKHFTMKIFGAMYENNRAEEGDVQYSLKRISELSGVDMSNTKHYVKVLVDAKFLSMYDDEGLTFYNLTSFGWERYERACSTLLR